MEPAENKIYRIKSGGGWKLATFDSEIALQNDSLEFLAFGHPIVENAISHFHNGKIGYNYKVLPSYILKDKVIFVFLVNFQFSLSRTEIFYIEYDHLENKLTKLSGIPEEIRKSHGSYEDEPNLSEVGSVLLEAYEYLETIIAKRREELSEQTSSLFQKEMYKIELTNQKTLRQLKEKLDRQEAQSLWEGKPERKSAINRTRNEIMKVRESFDREVRKIKHGSIINVHIELFQVYIGAI